MDLEEELSLPSQNQSNEIQSKSSTEALANGDDDLLGLDKQIKLTTRAKVAKIDNERIFDKNKGLSYIIRNYSKVSKTIKRNDKNLAKRMSQNPQYSSNRKRQAKFDNEFDNLSSVLQFYQLWCHSLFPKARFKDCLPLIRALGLKSSQLKLYRRELLDLEIRKLKVKNGLLDENKINKDNEVNIDNETTNTNENSGEVHLENGVNDNDNDDWSFMNVNNNTSSNNLFIGDDDIDENELYGSPKNQNNAKSNGQLLHEANEATNNHNINSKETNPGNFSDSDDPFSDDDNILLTETKKSNNEVISVPDEENFDEEDEYTNEMEVMREMGL